MPAHTNNQAPLLPPTPYADTLSPRPSDEYLAAQTALLRHLVSSPSDPFTAHTAARFTRGLLDTAEALRFCYYMRSQGLPTYAVVNPEGVGGDGVARAGRIRLFVLGVGEVRGSAYCLARVDGEIEWLMGGLDGEEEERGRNGEQPHALDDGILEGVIRPSNERLEEIVRVLGDLVALGAVEMRDGEFVVVETGREDVE